MKGFGDELFILPAPDSACYAYAMVNRQDALYSPGSPEIGPRQLAAEIIFDGTKLPLERRLQNTTTGGMKLTFSPELAKTKLRQFESYRDGSALY